MKLLFARLLAPSFYFSCMLYACIHWIGCSDNRVAGGYDDVENPALSLAFQNESGKTFNQGTVKVYARYQNPALNDKPIFASIINATGITKLHDSDLVKAMTSAATQGITWPNKDTIGFNILFQSVELSSTTAYETYEPDFIAIRNPSTNLYQFQQIKPNSKVLYPNLKGQLEINLPATSPALNLKGSVGTNGLDLNLKTVFISGSPYWATINADGSFSLNQLAKGKYNVKALSTDNKVYTASDSMDTQSSTPFNPSNWSEADIIWISK